MSAPAFNYRRMGGNLFSLGAGEVVSKLFSIFAFTWLGRTVGPENYGRLEFAFASVVFFNLPVDFGFGAYGAREVAKDRGRAKALAADISTLRFALSLISYTLLLGYAWLAGGDRPTRVLIATLGASLFAAPALLQWLFQGLERMRWVAWLSATRQVVFAVGSLLLVRSQEAFVAAGIAECAGAFTVAVVCLVLARRMGIDFQLFRFNWKRLVAHVRAAAPIGFSEMAWALLWYSPVVVLGTMKADPSVGWFGASHRAVTALHSFVYLYFFNLLPAMSRSSTSPGELSQLLERSIAFTAWVGVLVACVGTLVGGRMLAFLYGTEYAAGASILTILVLVIPVTLLSGHFRFGLIVCGRGKDLLYSSMLAAAACITVSVALVPLFGATGAAMGLLAGSVIHLILPYVQFRRIIAVPVVGAAFRPISRLFQAAREEAAR
jgi:PST family polysaccharide transporter